MQEKIAAGQLSQLLQEHPEQGTCLNYAGRVMTDSIKAGAGVGTLYGFYSALRYYFEFFY